MHVAEISRKNGSFDLVKTDTDVIGTSSIS